MRTTANGSTSRWPGCGSNSDRYLSTVTWYCPTRTSSPSRRRPTRPVSDAWWISCAVTSAWTRHYRTADGQLFLDTWLVQVSPVRLVATIAHELCHERLPASDAPITDDEEELVDLAAVYLGFGVFLANAAFESIKRAVGHHSLKFTTTRHGTLSEELYGYALARYTLSRDDPAPAWSRYLDDNPRAFLKRSLRFLDAI